MEIGSWIGVSGEVRLYKIRQPFNVIPTGGRGDMDANDERVNRAEAEGSAIAQ